MTLEVTAYSGLGPGPHDVNVTGLEVRQAKAGGYYLRWEFSDIAGQTASANSPQEMTPGNKTGRWFAALLNKPIEIGEKYELTDVIGKPASIFIELNPEGYTKVISVQSRVPKARAAVRPTAESVAASEAAASVPPAEATEAATDELPF